MGAVDCFYYYAFNLNIKSEIELPELIQFQSLPHTADITIQWSPIQQTGLEDSLVISPYYQAKQDAFWLNVMDVGRFLVTDGQLISIDPEPDADLASIRLFLLGSCMGALLMQRDLFLLHGNAIRFNNYCISFVGDSGAGKSTLSGAFFQRGYSILADDVCAINKNLSVIPSFPQIKLWQDAAEKLNIDTSNLKKIRPNFNKFALPLNYQFHPDPLPIRVIYCLNPGDTFKKHTVIGIHKLKRIHQHTYRRHYLKGLLKEPAYYLKSMEIAKHVEVIDLTRPVEGFQLEELLDFVEQDLGQRF